MKNPITLATRFDEENQNEPWQNDVAKELNVLLCKTKQKCLAPYGMDYRFVLTVRSLVRRIAEFENIQIKHQ